MLGTVLEARGNIFNVKSTMIRIALEEGGAV